LLVEIAFPLLSAVFGMAVLGATSCIRLASFVAMLLPKQLKWSTFSRCFEYLMTYIGDGRLEILITLLFTTWYTKNTAAAAFLYN
jgi:hypothetical protein